MAPLMLGTFSSDLLERRQHDVLSGGDAGNRKSAAHVPDPNASGHFAAAQHLAERALDRKLATSFRGTSRRAEVLANFSPHTR